jgi:hypothetical protein
VSDHGADPVDDSTPVFTQYDVFRIGCYLSDLWRYGSPGAAGDASDDIEQAVQSVLKP